MDFPPKKQTSDSVTSDLIALATFPTVAAAHLISQVLNYPSQPTLDDQLVKQLHASMSASLIITETYLSLCIILLVPTVLTQSTKRIVLLALTGLFCVASETYVFFAIPSIRNKADMFNRSFIIDSIPTLVVILGLVFILVLMLLYFIILTFKRPLPRAEPPPDADPEVLRVYRLLNGEPGENNIHILNFLTILYVPLAFVSITFSIAPIAGDLVPSLLRSLPSIVPTTGRSLVHEFFPETDTAIMELDQTVALLAGMTVLGFSLHSTADERYRIWWEKEKTSWESAARRMIESMLADEAADRSAPEVLEFSNLRNFRPPPPFADTVYLEETAGTV